MSVQISLAQNAECEAELTELGFRKEEVWIKWSGGEPKEGERIFWSMKHKPFQFLSASFWGAGED
jgi:hypothetical protein